MPTPICDSMARTCVRCLQHSQCTSAKPICDATTSSCAGCTTNAQCAMATPTTPVCLTDGTCAECRANADCAAKTTTPACFEGKCVQCTVDNDCAGTKPICNKMTNTCVACTGDMQCKDKSPDTPGCVTTAGATQGSCVACTTHAHCDKAANKPVCVANVCSACTADRQCVDKAGADPGVCMSHTDGHCATATEVLYVKPITGCSDTGTGTATAPFCNPQPAINAVTATKNVVVVRKGPLPLVKWSFAGTSPVSVIGQGGASVGPGAGVGITITSGELFIRNLGVSGMSDLGVSVAAGTTVKIDGCIVTANNGGLAVNGGGFEINNSVFAENLEAAAPPAFGGVYLKSGAGAPAQFRNNTIYANKGAGLVCDAAYPVRGLLVANNTGGQVLGCDVADNSSFFGAMPVDAHFDPIRPYRLTAQSLLCVDRGNTADFPPRDIDGNPRPSPAGGRPDCGAHELQE